MYLLAKRLSADKDHVIQLKAPKKANEWSLSSDCCRLSWKLLPLFLQILHYRYVQCVSVVCIEIVCFCVQQLY